MAEHTAPEQRTIDVDVEDVDTRGRTLHGYAAVYGATSGDLGGFRETIAPGAFRTVLDADVRCLLNHDPSQVLGRTRSGTLRLADEQRGLRFECDLPDSPLGENVRAAVKRGDIDGASFRFVVGEEDWTGDLRTVRSVKELQDVTVATYGAYPDASVELRMRTTNNDGEHRQKKGADMAAEDGAVVEQRENENQNNQDQAEERVGSARAESTGSLKVEDRVQGAGAPMGLADAFRSRGWPGERVEISWPEYRRAGTISTVDIEFRTLAVSGAVDDINQAERASAPYGYDQRYVWPVVPTVPVGSDVTSVHVLQQTARSLASASNVIRDIDAVTAKPETGSTVDDLVVSLKQVASIQSGISNILLEQPAFRTVIEQDLRHALDGGLDKLVLDGVAASGFQAPGTDQLLVSIRKAMSTIQAAGYNPDTLVLTPANLETLDTLTSGITGADNDYVFAPAQLAPRTIFGLQVRISKTIPAAAVLDSQAFGKLYISPISLARFEEDAGATNKSTVRLEGHAAWGTERQDAAVRIAAS